MVVSLLRLADGGCSLEFASKDAGAVFAMVRALHGAPSIEKRLASASVGFGGAKFVYQDASDDPCLISIDPHGAEILEQLAARLAG